MSRLLLTFCLALISGLLPLRAGVILITQDKSAWITAVGGSYLTEDFNDTSIRPELSYTGDHGQLTVPVFTDWVAAGEYYGHLEFSILVLGAGANWDLTPNGPGTGVRMTIYYEDSTEEVVSLQVPNTSSGEFFGFVTDKPFFKVTYSGGSQAHGPNDINEEHLTLDDLVFSAGSAPLTGVPEPGTWGLTAGVLGFLLLAKRWTAR